MAQGEVVLDRIIRIEISQRSTDLGSHVPARAAIACQPEATTDPGDMRVEWDDELRRRDISPATRIDAIAADHPAQKQIEALATTPAVWPREEEKYPRALRDPAAVGCRQIERTCAGRKRIERRV